MASGRAHDRATLVVSAPIGIAAADLRVRLQRELDARELPS